VIDDALTIRETLRRMLTQTGYKVSVAETGEKGLALAEIEQPDLIFLDIVLPDLSGFRALRRLRSRASTQEMPVIMISGNSGAIEKFFLQRVGADDFIGKPFGRYEVFSAMERLIRAGALSQRMAS
ncbi:MAG: response regulator, partial [Pseudomonadota bacterium]